MALPNSPVSFMHATTGPSDTGLLKSQAAQENVSKYLAGDDKSNRRGFGTMGYMKHEEIRGKQTRIKKNFDKYFSKVINVGRLPRNVSHIFLLEPAIYFTPGLACL